MVCCSDADRINIGSIRYERMAKCRFGRMQRLGFVTAVPFVLYRVRPADGTVHFRAMPGELGLSKQSGMESEWRRRRTSDRVTSKVRHRS